MATADNLKIAQQLLATMQQITAQVEKQTEAYHAQAQLVDALCKAQDCFGKIDAVKVKEVTEALREAQEKTKEFGKEIEEVAEKEVGKLEGAVRKLAEGVKNLSIPAEFLGGFRSGLNLSTNLFKNILSMGGSAFGLLKDIGGIFLSLPGRLLDFFQGAAGGGTDEYKGALEELRKEFGNLEVGTSAAVKNMTESMHGLGESGLRMSQVFGYGRAGLAKLLRENMEIAKGMGPIFSEFAASLRGSERDFTVLRKATGLNAEALKTFYITAREGGVDTGTAIKQLTKDIARAERTFGITAKEYGADLNYMMKETGTFGIMAPKQMLTVATYARKLGLSMEALKKVMDKSLNFEDAAQQAAKLSEGFNMNIDAMKLMKAQNPTEKLEMMRKAFFKTGRNIEQMTIQERKYLAETAGVSEEEARLAFSQKNRALSGAALDAQMKKSQKQQISQQEAMQQLAKSIERLVQSGSAMKGSFFDIFAKGFESGVRRSKEFREVTRNLQRSLRAVYLAGREVGRMFVHEFPGFKNMLKGLAETFDPRRFRELMSSIIGEFRKFFKALQTDPKAGVQEFMKNMKKIFFDFFTKGTPSGMKFLDGLKSFFKAVGAIFVEGIRYALTTLKDLLKTVIDFVKNPAALTSGASELGGGLTGMFVQAFQYVVKELGPVLKDVGGLLVDLLSTLYTEYIQPHIGQIILGAVAFFFGPALILGFVRGASVALMQIGVSLIIDQIKQARRTVDGATRAPEGDRDTTPSGQARQAAKIRNLAKGFADIAKAMVLFTGAMFIMVAAIIGLAALYEASGVKPESMLLLTAVFGAVSLLFYGMIKSGILKAIEELGSKQSWKTIGDIAKGVGAGLVALGLLMVGVAAIVAISSAILSKVNKASVELFMNVMESMTELFIALSASMLILFVVGETLIKSGGAVILPILAGLAGVGLLLVGITSFAANTIASFVKEMRRANVTPEYAKEVGGILTSFVDVITKLTGAVTLLAFSGPFAAIGGIAASLVGAKNPFETLTEIIGLIKKAFVDILTTLNQMTGDPSGLKAKAEVFSIISTGLGALMGPIVSLITDISDDFFAGVSAEAAARSAYALIDVVKILADKDRGVIPKLMEQIKQIAENQTADPDKLKAAAELFTVIATGLSEIMKAVAELISKLDTGIILSPMAVVGIVGKLQMLTQITETLLPTIQKVMTKMLTEIVAISSTITNIEGLKAIGSILGSVSQFIVGILTAITGLISDEGAGGAINAFNNLIGGGILTNIMNDKLISIQSFIGNFSGSIRRLLVGVDGRGGIFGGIKQIVDGLPTEPAKLKALSTVSDIIKSITGIITPIIDAVTNLTKNIRPGEGINTRQINAVGDQISGVITSITLSFSSLFAGIPELVKGLAEITLPTGIESKVKALGSIFDLIKNISSIISGFNINIGGGSQRTLNMWSEVFVPIIALMSYFVMADGAPVPGVPDAKGHKGAFEAILNGINTVNFPPGISGKVKNSAHYF